MKQLIPYDFEQIKQEIVTKYQEKGYNAEYEGSNVSILATLMSYVISLLNVNTSFGINELLLTQSSILEFAKASARQLSYEPQNRVSFVYNICMEAQLDVGLPDDDLQLRLYEIQKYAKFTDGTNNYYYMGETITRFICNNDITIDDDIKYFNIPVKEGLLLLNEDNQIDLTFTIGETKTAYGNLTTLNYVDIPFRNVEENGIELFITYYDEDGNLHTDEFWEKSTSFLIEKDSVLTKKYVRMQNLDYNTVRTYFNIAGIGNNLIPGSVVKANITLSSGLSGRATSTIEIDDSVRIIGDMLNYSGFDTTKIQTIKVNGSDEEDIDSIKENAPVFFNSANRAVTKDDYISICNRQGLVAKTIAWGGEDEIPVTLGNVWISMTPQYTVRGLVASSSHLLWELDKKDTLTNIYLRPEEVLSNTYTDYNKVINPGVFDILKDYRFPALRLWHRNPVFVDFEYKLKVVKYNLNKTRQEIHSDIVSVVDSYFSRTLEQFEVDYYNSNLIKRMDAELSDLTGIEVEVATFIPIYSENIVYEKGSDLEGNIVIFLARPFEDLFDDNLDLIPGILPSITTSNFITTGDLLEIDFSSIIETPLAHIGMHKRFSFEVKYNGVKVGTYTVVNDFIKYIRVDLYLKHIDSTGTTGSYDESTLINTMFSGPTVPRLNLNYVSPNFRTLKNTINRLAKIEFAP